MTLPPLYAVLDPEAAGRAGLELEAVAAACLRGGARFLQVRAKALAGAALLRTCTGVTAQARHHGGVVIVNDRADVARLSGAAGVHVGQEDLPPAAVRKIVGDHAILGVSTHTPAQIAAAVRLPVTYIAVGPVFGTRTKDTGYEPVGLDLVQTAASAVRASGRALAVVAIGGITLERAPAALAAGADSVAVVGDLLATGDPEARTRAFVEALAAS